MTKTEKEQTVQKFVDTLQSHKHFYVADIAGLDSGMTTDLRRKAYGAGIKLMVVKNTLFKRALDTIDMDMTELYPLLKGNSAIFFTETANAPAKLMKEFRSDSTGGKPLLKGAFVEESFYVGEQYLSELAALKSREELLADVIGLLQSPMKNLLGSLSYGANTISGLLKSIEEKS